MPYGLEKDGTRIKEWNSLPKRVVFPNGDHVHAPKVGHKHDGCEIVEFTRPVPPKQPPNASQVAQERDRRLALGFDYDFGDARGKHRIGTTAEDLAGWDEVSKFAGALIDSGDMERTIDIVTDTGPCRVTAPEWRAIEIAAAEYRQPLWAKSFVLQSAKAIPEDFADDKHWA